MRSCVEALLARRLRRRLAAYYEIVGVSPASAEDEDDTGLQRQTGEAALHAAESIHHAARGQEGASPSASASTVPLFGARDLQTIRTLLGILANWNFGHHIDAYDRALAAFRGRHDRPKLQEVTEEENDAESKRKRFVTSRRTLSDAAQRVQNMLPDASALHEPRPIGAALLSACSLHILAAGLRLGWGPVGLPTDLQQDDVAKQGTSLVSRLLKGLPTLTCLKLLSGVGQIGSPGAGSGRGVPPFVKSAIEMLFSAQLLRSDGVMALLRNTFATEDSHDRGLMKKLVKVGHLLSTPPPRMPLEVFASAIVPRLLEVIGELPSTGDAASQPPSQQSSPAQKNAACFALARLYQVAPRAVQRCLQVHVYDYICPSTARQSTQENDVAVAGAQLSRAVILLAEVVNQSEPSSQFVTDVLAPVIVPLFALHIFIAEERNPSISLLNDKGKRKESVLLNELSNSLLQTWLRLADVDKAVTVLAPNASGIFGLAGKESGALSPGRAHEDGLQAVLSRDDSVLSVRWQRRTMESTALTGFDKLSLHDLGVRLSESTTGEESSLPPGLLTSLHLKPSPQYLTQLINKAERKDVAAAVLSHLLDAYSSSRQTRTSDSSTLGVLYIQHILRLIDTFGSDVLQGQPEKILSFIDFALGRQDGKSSISAADLGSDNETTRTEADIPYIYSRPSNTTSIISELSEIGNDSKMKAEEGQTTGLREDNDDDDDEELIETALSLLLSLLEGNPSMTFESHSMLLVIASKVNALSTHASTAVRRLAKEASLVLKARQSASVAETSQTELLGTPKELAFAKGRAMYQEALRLLQDPILPVRAHGLVVLKELVGYGTTEEHSTILMDPALTIGILDIFIQAVCDDESFLYLNAVKGLAEMGNTGGHAMVRRLMAIYIGPVATQSLSQAEVDKRLRVGEALLQVVQKLEEALAPYTVEIVAPLLSAVRQAALPTTLRSSMLSILGTCIEACPQAMVKQGYAQAICDAMLDLLSLETDTRGTTTQEQMDNVLETNTKVPQLRRAGLLLLSLLVRGATLQMQSADEKQQKEAWQDDKPQLSTLRLPGGGVWGTMPDEKASKRDKTEAWLLFSQDSLPRTESVVGYVAQLDSDAFARHQAEEVLHDIETYKLYFIHSSVQS